MLKKIIAAVFATCATHYLPVHAEVTESLTFKTYPIGPVYNGQLTAAINAASPIREGNEIFHGYTKWYIQWHFLWQTNASGACKIKSVNTELSGTITLPTMSQADAASTAQFERYLSALRTHELGHFANGKETAHAIDKGILLLPEMANCQILEAAANDLGHRLLQVGNAQDRQYDASTQHGKTQGAWLTR